MPRKARIHKCYRCESRNVKVHEEWSMGMAQGHCETQRFYYIGCRKCGLRIDGEYTEEEAIKSWNEW
jgi:hypothetical protein